jgi:hypothetical protein
MTINSRIDRIEDQIAKQQSAPPPAAVKCTIDYDQVAIDLEEQERASAQRCGYSYERYVELFNASYRHPDGSLNYDAWSDARTQAISEAKVTK